MIRFLVLATLLVATMAINDTGPRVGQRFEGVPPEAQLADQHRHFADNERELRRLRSEAAAHMRHRNVQAYLQQVQHQVGADAAAQLFGRFADNETTVDQEILRRVEEVQNWCGQLAEQIPQQLAAQVLGFFVDTVGRALRPSREPMVGEAEARHRAAPTWEPELRTTPFTAPSTIPQQTPDRQQIDDDAALAAALQSLEEQEAGPHAAERVATNMRQIEEDEALAATLQSLERMNAGHHDHDWPQRMENEALEATLPVVEQRTDGESDRDVNSDLPVPRQPAVPDCVVCTEPIRGGSVFPDEHPPVCRACEDEHVATQVRSNADPIRCCNGCCTYAYEDVIGMAPLRQDRSLRDRYDNAMLQRSMSRPWHCPSATCQLQGDLEQAPGENEPSMMSCPQCQTISCMSCRQLWTADDGTTHFGKRCDEFADAKEDSSHAVIQQTTKPCPQCRTPIEKNEGCQHMHCTLCNHHFCWTCMQPWVGHDNYYRCNMPNGPPPATDLD